MKLGSKMSNTDRSIWRTPETYLGALGFLGMLALGFWYAGGFRVFLVIKPVIQG